MTLATSMPIFNDNEIQITLSFCILSLPFKSGILSPFMLIPIVASRLSNSKLFSSTSLMMLLADIILIPDISLFVEHEEMMNMIAMSHKTCAANLLKIIGEFRCMSSVVCCLFIDFLIINLLVNKF